MAVADEHRTRAQQEVDILVAADVPDASAATLADHDVAREVAETAGGQHALRQLEQCLFFLAAGPSSHIHHSANAIPIARRRDLQSPTRTVITVANMKQTEL